MWRRHVPDGLIQMLQQMWTGMNRTVMMSEKMVAKVLREVVKQACDQVVVHSGLDPDRNRNITELL